MTDIVDRARAYTKYNSGTGAGADNLIDELADEIKTMRQQTDDWKKITAVYSSTIVQKDKEIEHLLEVIDKLRDGRVV